MASALPPVTPGLYVLPAPTMNLSRRSGVPLVPLHSNQPEGMEAIDPDHMTITPLGRMFNKLFCTNEVVATWVLLVPFAAVGAVATPVNVEVPVIDRLPPVMLPEALTADPDNEPEYVGRKLATLVLPYMPVN